MRIPAGSENRIERALAWIVCLTGCILLEIPAPAVAGEIWGVPVYSGAVLEEQTLDGTWSVARYQARDRVAKVIDFYSGLYGEPVLEGGKWRFDTKSPDLGLEVAEISLGPDAGKTILFVRHRGGGADKASAEKPGPVETNSEAIWGVPVYPGAVRHGLMEAGAKKYVTFSTPAGPDRVVEFYVSKFGKPGDLPPNRKVIKATKQGVEIMIAPGEAGGAEITYTSTKPLGK